LDEKELGVNGAFLKRALVVLASTEKPNFVEQLIFLEKQYLHFIKIFAK
jgi:hypothetical protein